MAASKRVCVTASLAHGNSVPPPSHLKVISKHLWDFTKMTEEHSEIAQHLTVE